MATPAEVDAKTLARIDQTSTLTGEIIDNTEAFMQSLRASATDIEIPYIDYSPIIFTPASIDIDAEAPVAGTDGEIANVDAPDEFVPEEISLNVEDVPNLEVTEPQVNIPSTPSTTLPNMPSEPTVNDVSVPNKPAYNLPTAPTITDFAIPDPPSVVIPEFAGSLPVNTLVAPSGNLEWSEAEYNTLLLTAVKSKLLNDVENGVTGFGTDVLDDLWALQAERDQIAYDDAIDKVVDEWAERGFPVPDGVIAAAVDEAAVDFANRRADRAREINIKEADLIQKNNHFAMASAMQTEGMLIQHANNVAERSLRAAMATIQMGIAIFDAQVRNYNAQLEAYRVQAMVYEQLIRAELAKVEVYRAQIEGTKLRVEVQRQYVEIYQAQIEAVNTILRAYKTEMEAANIQAEVEKSKVEVFRALVAGYMAQVQAKTAEFGMFKAQIDGEMSKVKIYESQVKAYGVKIEGIKAKISSQIAVAGAEIDVEKLKLLAYNSNILKYRAEVDAAIEKVRALVAMYGADISKYNTTVGKGEAEARIQALQQEVVLKNIDGNTRAMMEAAKSNLGAFVNVANIKVEAAKGGASAYSAMASSAMQAIAVLLELSSGGVTTTTTGT